jgi:glycosyltransferase involved in cell wall biosynthesis
MAVNKKRIFLMGMSPMPFENDLKVYGTGIRTWQFVKPLIEAGHNLCVCNYAIPSAYKDNFKSVFNKDFRNFASSKNEGPGSAFAGFEYNILSSSDFEDIFLLKDIYAGFEPDCIVGCSFYPSFIASKLAAYFENPAMRKPFWADLFGHVMAEAQARAASDDDDGCLFHYWNSEYSIISTADIFSCVSNRQGYALAGELGAAGRLNKYSSGYEFAVTVPCGMPSEEFIHTKNVIRGKNGVKDDDFIVLWTGGYNTWTDVDTLFEGLENAMKANPSVKFVSTGAEIPEQDLKTYPRFLSMIEKSPYRDNFIMKGWIDGQDVPNYYFEADVGINIDKDIYEVKLGSKNRILDWMRAGLAVLSSNVCELTDILQSQSIGYTFRPGDAADLARMILKLAKGRQMLKETAARAKKYGLLHFSFDATAAPLLEWVKCPSFAPDYKKERKIILDGQEAFKNLQIISLNQQEMIKQKDARIRELEARLHKNPLYRFGAYLRAVSAKTGRKK